MRWRAGNPDMARSSVQTSVSSPFDCAPVIGAMKALECPAVLHRSYAYTASSATTGVPSEYLAPFLIFWVMVRPSGDTVSASIRSIRGTRF